MRQLRYLLCVISFVGLIGCFKSSPNESGGRTIDHSLFDSLLTNHVRDGFVDYNGFESDRELLNVYLKILSNNPPSTNWTNEEKLAYWINVYNAFTIELILRHRPLKSIKDITAVDIPFVNTPWQIDFIEIGDETYNLDDVEHGIIRQEFNEPRIHFALVCASISCPKLRSEAYNGRKLNKQLTEQTKEFLSDPKRNVITQGRVRISKIFQWYKEDFTREGRLIDFLNRYSSVKISDDASVDYLDYNWELNSLEKN